jgi:hypothetical protein
LPTRIYLSEQVLTLPEVNIAVRLMTLRFRKMVFRLIQPSLLLHGKPDDLVRLVERRVDPQGLLSMLQRLGNLLLPDQQPGKPQVCAGQVWPGLQHLAVMLHCRVVLTQPLEQFGQPGANDVIIGTRHG